MRAELHDMASRLATRDITLLCLTYIIVLIPILFWILKINSKIRNRMFEHMNSLTNAMVCSDIKNILNFVAHMNTQNQNFVEQLDIVQRSICLRGNCEVFINYKGSSISSWRKGFYR